MYPQIKDLSKKKKSYNERKEDDSDYQENQQTFESRTTLPKKVKGKINYQE